MPKYTITAPNGRKYAIDGPEGATRDEVIARIKEKHPDVDKAPDTSGKEEFRQAVSKAREDRPPMGALQGALIPGAGMAAGGIKYGPPIARSLAGGAVGAYNEPENRMAGFLKGAGLNALVEGVAGMPGAIMAKIPGLKSLAKVKQLLETEAPAARAAEGRVPTVAANFEKPPVLFDASGRQIPIQPQPLKVAGQTFEPPVGGRIASQSGPTADVLAPVPQPAPPVLPKPTPLQPARATAGAAASQLLRPKEKKRENE